MRYNDIDDGSWRGLSAEIAAGDVPRRPPWRTELARPGRVRLRAGEAVRWWARMEGRYAFVSLLRGAEVTRDDAVVRPITAEDLREAPDAPGSVAWWRHWARWFLRAMLDGGRSPLHRGTWALMPTVERAGPSLPVRAPRRPPAPAAWRWDLMQTPLLGADGPLWTDDRFDVDWYAHNGARRLLPMRRASPPDSGRVKMWRKRAREGTLPPVLVHLVSALDLFALLDGHDRFAAARAEGVAVPWLHATAVGTQPAYLDPARSEAIARQIDRMMGNTPPVPAASMNALALQAFDDRPVPCRICYGWPIEGGAALWDDEVSRRLDALGIPHAPALLPMRARS